MVSKLKLTSAGHSSAEVFVRSDDAPSEVLADGGQTLGQELSGQETPEPKVAVKTTTPKARARKAASAEATAIKAAAPKTRVRKRTTPEQSFPEPASSEQPVPEPALPEYPSPEHPSSEQLTREPPAPKPAAPEPPASEPPAPEPPAPPASPANAEEIVPSFSDFALVVYPFLELQSFHRVYYRVLEAFAAGRIRRLIVTMPPQHGKSVGATTLLPAYLLGLDPDLRVAIASYSGALASKFNRRVQRILESREYVQLFPATTIKHGTRPASYIRTADEVEIIDRRGGLLSVGREGSLTGNRVDCFILDDLYKDALEANSPLIRANCWEWYTSVVRTRMHNTSRELIVFTRWHEEDLIGTIAAREEVVALRSWEQLEQVPSEVWLYLNFEALKASLPSELDPRVLGAALWEQQHGEALLEAKRRLDPVQFEAMYQGHPSSREGLLYGGSFAVYDQLPHEIVRRANYTDTADTGDDYLCSLSYSVDADGVIYVTDVVYSREPMEITEPLVAQMLELTDTRLAVVESNNGGRGFARSVQRLAPGVRVEWFHQSANKEARILSNSSTALHRMRWPRDWGVRWPELYAHLTTYKRQFRSNRWHDAADVVTGVVERETAGQGMRRVQRVRWRS